MQTLDLILEENPAPLVEINADLPAELWRIVHKTLAKQPGMRYQTAADLVIDLRTLASDPDSSFASRVERGTIAGAGAKAAPVRSALAAPRALALILLTAVVAATAAWFLKPDQAPGSEPVTRFDILIDEYSTRANASSRSLAISPSGTHIAYVVNDELRVRASDQIEPWVLPGTDGASSPVFSPDGRSIAYIVGRDISIVPVDGGTPVPLGVEASGDLTAWTIGDRLLFIDRDGSIAAVASTGGSPEILVEADEESTLKFPSLLPDGGVLFNILLEGRWSVAVKSPTKDRRVLFEGTSPRYVSTGHILHALGTGVLFARTFDLSGDEPPGPRTLVVEGVSTNPGSGTTEYDVSANGDLAYWPARGASAGLDLILYWVDLDGSETRASEHTDHFRLPRLSPDGTSVATIIRNEDGTDDIWVLDLERDIPTRITNAGDNHSPTWTPDGSTLIYASNIGFTDGALRVAAGNLNLYREPADQSGSREVLLEDPDWEWASSVTPDGETLLYSDRTPELEWSIWTLSLTDLEARPLIQEPGFVAKDAEVSPNGEWFAYWSDRSDRSEVYVERFPDGGGRQTISSNGGQHPSWAPDGSKIYYAETPRRMMVVDVTPGESIGVSRPRLLFEGNYASESERNYDVHRDGTRLLMLKAADSAAGTGRLRLHVVFNWFEELKERVPTGR
jgi:Tol biopolymer transport system component